MSTAVWLSISGVIVKPQLEMTCAAFAAVVPMTRRRVHGEMMPGRARSRRERHDRDERFGKHAAESDQPHVRFLFHHLGCGAEEISA
jgi:hypothetical protein